MQAADRTSSRSPLLANLERLFWGITGGAASGLLILVGPYLLLATLGMAVFRDPDETKHLFYIWGAALVACAYIPLAIAGHRRLGRELRTIGHENEYVAKSFLLGLALPFLALWIRSDLKSRAELRSIRDRDAGIQRSEQKAQRAAEAIFDCVHRYAERQPAAGYPASLQQIGPNGDRCLLPTIASGNVDSIRLIYTPALRNDRGRIEAFTLCGAPERSDWTGISPVVLMDEEKAQPHGVWRGRCDRSSLWGSRAPAQSWSWRIKYCAIAFAASHPNDGYPATLEMISGSEVGCIATDSNVGIVGQTLFWRGKPLVSYVPAAGDANGRIGSFAVQAAEN